MPCLAPVYFNVSLRPQRLLFRRGLRQAEALHQRVERRRVIVGGIVQVEVRILEEMKHHWRRGLVLYAH